MLGVAPQCQYNTSYLITPDLIILTKFHTPTPPVLIAAQYNTALLHYILCSHNPKQIYQLRLGSVNDAISERNVSFISL